MVTWDVDAKGESVGPSQVRADALVGKIGTRFLVTSSRTTDVVAGRKFTTNFGVFTLQKRECGRQ